MTKTLLLSLAVISLTACAKEAIIKDTSAKEPFVQKISLKQDDKPLVCNTKPIAPPLKIIDKPIDFGVERIAMTKEYIKTHYGKTVSTIEIVPKIILLHWTAEMSFDKSFKRLQPEKLLTDRKDIAKASLLNVSSQFLVARDGTVYRLMPENWMARHVIGLNYSSIGVENVGGKDNKKDDLTPAQVKANIALVRYLKGKYPTIEYLVGHHEYRQMEKTALWLERDSGYRTVKSDPGDAFMDKVHSKTRGLGLKRAP
ncbi:MAG: peptidoglycan recognition protein family protein [Sulfurovum sp.]|nr:peptidoglycan recognition protein family protein [Sulfurovum sp.]